MPTQPPVKPILANYFSNKLIQAKIVNESLLLDDDDVDDIVVCVQEYNQTHSLLSTEPPNPSIIRPVGETNDEAFVEADRDPQSDENAASVHYGMFHHGKENVEGMDDFVDAADAEVDAAEAIAISI